ncbi:MAG TPA: NINE protein [Gemmataceae bacterium]|nr:NINE protein [Gemmataceae bacterium]
MPKIQVNCPTCNETLEIDDKYAGQEVECGSCFQVFVAKSSRPKSKRARDDDEGDRRPARTSSRRSRRDDDDDDYPHDHEDDDDDRPRRRRRRTSSRVPPKSRAVYIILGILLGGLGIHNFYAGRNGPGTSQLVIFLVSIPLLFVCIGAITILIPGIWALVDVCTVDRDGDGRLMV